MEERESRALLDTLFQQALVPEYQFRHHWEPHTIAMWDNRSTQHYAVHDYYPQRRYMERVTIKGGPVTGVERADPASVRKAKILVPDERRRATAATSRIRHCRGKQAKRMRDCGVGWTGLSSIQCDLRNQRADRGSAPVMSCAHNSVIDSSGTRL